MFKIHQKTREIRENFIVLNTLKSREKKSLHILFYNYFCLSFYLCTFWFPITTPKVTRKKIDTKIDSRQKSQPSREQNQGSRNFFFFFPSVELNAMFGTMVYASSSKPNARTILFFRKILDFEYLKRIVIRNTTGKETRLAASPTKTSFSVRSTSPKDTSSESLKKLNLLNVFFLSITDFKL